MKSLAPVVLLAVVGTAGAVFSAVGVQQPPPDQAAPVSLTLPAPTFPAVVRAMKDPRQALAALDRELAQRGGDPPIESFVLRAYLLAGANRSQESVAAWDDAGRRDGNLSVYAARSAISVLLTARDADGALARVRALPERSASVRGAPTTLERDLLLLSVAETYQAIGRPVDATPIFREVLSREGQTAAGDRARLALAAGEEAAGHLDAALESWHQATVDWRLADSYGTARAAERRVAARLGRQPLPCTEDEYFSIASRLGATSHFDDAVALLEEGKRLGRITATERLEANIVQGLYNARRNDEAMARADDFLARFNTSRLATDVRLTQLRLDIRMGKIASARKRLASMRADRSVPADVTQSAGRLVAAQLVATGSPRDGLSLFRSVLAASRVRTDRYDLAWRAGIAALRAGDNRSAGSLFTQARRLAPSRSSPRSSEYWLAAALQKAGDDAQARRLWTQLVDENAFDYYGLRAAERLRRPVVSTTSSASVTFPSFDISTEVQAAPEFRAAIVLARAGLISDSASLLRTLAASARGDRGLALLAARAAYAAEDYATAWSLVATRFALFLAQPAAGVPGDVWEMAFPRAYWSEVNQAAMKAGVDPLLLLSLMRRESRFVAAARSRTGAVGLFQIMPYTARELTGAAEEPAEGEQVLEAPASSDLAARLVKRIMDRFGNAIAPVVASYNAGEEPVERWWRTAANLPEDLFVDSIPYGETRQYVREVLANYATYRRLYK